MMKRIDLDRAFPKTPQAFSERVDQTLRQMKEEKPMKRITLRAVLAAALITLLIGGIAYAAISLGQEWYFNNRFTAYQEHEPEKYRAIMDNLTKDIIQENRGEAAELVSLKVQDVSWSKEQKVLTLSYSAEVKDPGRDEMYALWELDQDGLWGSEETEEDDPESRTEHWLFAPHAQGIPRDVMKDPAKRLLLMDYEGDVYIGDSGVMMPMWMSDTLSREEGPVICLQEFDLKQLEDAEIKKNYEDRAVPQGWDKADYEKYLRDEEARLLKRAGEMRKALEEGIGEDGFLSLRFPYKVWFYDLEKNEPGGSAAGELLFKVKAK